MNKQKTLTTADLAAIKTEVWKTHPFVTRTYCALMFMTMCALMGGFMTVMSTLKTGNEYAILALLLVFGIFGAYLYARGKTFTVPAATWSRLYSDYEFQTFAGEKVRIEQANISGHLVSIRFEDGTFLREYPIQNLCNADGERHLADATDSDKSLENISGIRWMTEGCAGILRASRERYRDLPQYLLKLDDGRHVWCSMNEMRPAS